MGRLKRSLPKRFIKILRVWAVPVGIASILVVGVNFGFADPEPTVDQLTQYLQTNQLAVGSDTIDGYQQVYYVYNDQRFYITSGETNNFAVKASGQYIAWLTPGDGPTEIYLYDVLAKTLLEVTNTGVNSDLSMQGNQMVWQKWMDEDWQIFYYDGSVIQQISSGDSTGRAHLHNNTVAYMQYVPNDPNGQPWHVLTYDTQTQQTQTIVTSSDALQAWPYFDKDGNLQTQYSLDYLGAN